ncbi:MAG: hypothetical protein WBA77_09510 [Microcoleaceae cyanobacterium]
MAYWIKILHERNVYVVDLDSLSAFCIEDNKRVQFWLPDSGQAIVINPHSNPDVYYKIVDYIKKTTSQSSEKFWVKIAYQRHQYVIDLTRINTFSCDCSQRIIFWLPNSQESIVVNPKSNPHDYEKVQEYIRKTTGFSLP